MFKNIKTIEEIMYISDGINPLNTFGVGLGYKPYLNINGGDINDSDDENEEFKEQMKYWENNYNDLDENEMLNYLDGLIQMKRIYEKNILNASEIENIDKKIYNTINDINYKYNNKYFDYNNYDNDDYIDYKQEENNNNDDLNENFYKIINRINYLESIKSKTKKDKEELSQLFKMKYEIMKRKGIKGYGINKNGDVVFYNHNTLNTMTEEELKEQLNNNNLLLNGENYIYDEEEDDLIQKNQ